LRQHEIVRAFVNERSQQPFGAREVGRGRNDRPLSRLGRGHDHRGATWHDEEARVVWLCACGRHRSGQEDDAFQHFFRLIDADIIYPTEDDYRLLEDERARRFGELVRDDAAALRARAEQQPETEVRGAIGAEHEVSVVNVVVEMVGNELFVAFPARVFPGQLVLVLAAFAPEAEWTDWREVAHSRRGRSRPQSCATASRSSTSKPKAAAAVGPAHLDQSVGLNSARLATRPHKSPARVSDGGLSVGGSRL
jgi:hypothetical protein